MVGFDRELNPELPVPKISSTVGASLVNRNVTINNKTVKMQVLISLCASSNTMSLQLLLMLKIWDTAGQERFRAMAPLYYRKANAAIILYDVCDWKSFQASKSWVTGTTIFFISTPYCSFG